MARKLPFPVFDVDNHMYETTDAFTKYLPEEYSNLIKYVEMKGRTKIAIKNQISDYIPNPTFNVVASPGAWEIDFKLKNPSSKTKPGDKKSCRRRATSRRSPPISTPSRASSCSTSSGSSGP